MYSYSKDIIRKTEGINYSMDLPGIPLVLLHGFTENHHLWDDLIPNLGEVFSIIRPDLPGHGRSELPDSIQTLEDVADWLVNFLKSLQVRKCYIAGHSLGGYIALAAAQKYPEFFESLCLVHSTPLDDTPEKKDNRNRAIEFIRTHGGAGFIETLVPGLFAEDFKARVPEKVRASLDRALQTPDDTLLRYLEMMRDRPSSLAWVESGLTPVSAILGSQDPLIPCEYTANLMYNCPDSHVEVMHNSAHMGMLEEPQIVGKALSLFLAHKR
jgi:pimeloyl-ACP methyl ester carboxylesterase